jgi:hypothetical protein
MVQFFDALAIPVERRGPGEGRRIGVILRAHGYERRRIRDVLQSGSDDPQPKQKWVWSSVVKR